MQKSVSEDRWKYLGGSDIPIIMELSPFKSRFDLLLEKAQYKEDDFSGNAFTDYGNKMEEKIRDFINETLIPDDEESLTEGKHIKKIPTAWGKSMSNQMKIRAHTDGENESTILEVKTTSHIFKTIEENELYLVQLLFYMMSTGKKKGILAVYDRPDDLSETFEPERLHCFLINLDDFSDECAKIIKAISKFLDDLAKVKANPFITEEELLPSLIPDITSRIIAFEQQLSHMKEMEKKIKAEKERLKDAMQAGGIKSWQSDNGYKIMLVEDTPETVKQETSFNLEKFKEENPELADKYTETSNVIVPAKKGYVKITAPKEEKK